ncbi:hypothetical protein TorRG33x02_290340 [Trema orientale]|uniref:Uncharacterized protein n=1 Tax=Trema orientale TaxID=63057 RepID=A0A2P5CCA8_TREOI|nr:hypothetical protein TorRG33x02_290340 [Trema orientale]
MKQRKQTTVCYFLLNCMAMIHVHQSAYALSVVNSTKTKATTITFQREEEEEEEEKRDGPQFLFNTTREHPSNNVHQPQNLLQFRTQGSSLYGNITIYGKMIIEQSYGNEQRNV